MGTEHSHWSVFDSCQNISTIAYLFYLSFVLGVAVGGLMLHLKVKEFCDDPAFKASVGFLLAASPMRLMAPRMTPSMKRSKATTPKKMK